MSISEKPICPVCGREMKLVSGPDYWECLHGDPTVQAGVFSGPSGDAEGLLVRAQLAAMEKGVHDSHPHTHADTDCGRGTVKRRCCDCVLPCGRSAHLEAGYCAGQRKPTFFLLSPDRFEPELMYLLGDGCFVDLTGIREILTSLDNM